jgi:hypothetical protein
MTKQLSTSQLGRKVPTDTELMTLVGNALTAFCNAGRTFSAHDVTSDLRVANPNLEIAHDRVRPVVHTGMRLVIGAGLYDAIQGAYTRYVPVATAHAPSAPQMPAQRATAASAPASTGDVAALSGLPLLALNAPAE